ncbi:cAMP-activated global transcriptional regulator CRP [Ectothiorhodospira sp. BSL-9]|uniref:cAMP-activated global transcriptional regulator CRP n=1 Tax=Ectothiorhodospira sp. BSL-9 TaxID=1442136 RepID=UPI0007B42A91|nr:cAMP-activated global transcriptional regulator CRP [Ectothiorhodospira sp. BSL-9]ANB02189.1 cyclic AMP receptor protein [Ectothiorhodospira sp. BSL-9]TVQ74454.1 MAG: cAMP-activated global transcriptional regulator CRP [Chromatiaceae bacterium]
MSSLLKQQQAPEEALDKLLAHCHRRQYPARATIIHAGDRPDTLYYIIQGSVSVMIEDELGHEMVLAYLNPGQFFGEMGVFSSQARSAGIVTRTPTETAEIHYPKFIELAMQDPTILFLLATQMAVRLRETSRKVIDLAFLDVTGRIARTLMELAQQPDAMTHPKGMQIRVTRQELAKIVGCSREMAGRVLKDLEERELITAKGKTVVVFNAR